MKIIIGLLFLILSFGPILFLFLLLLGIFKSILTKLGVDPLTADYWIRGRMGDDALALGPLCASVVYFFVGSFFSWHYYQLNEVVLVVVLWSAIILFSFLVFVFLSSMLWF